MNYPLNKNIRDQESHRTSFNALAGEVFDLSFEKWYQEGYWTDHYIPYVLLEDKKVIANISVNTMDILFNGQIRQYLQLGTVMTSPDYRKQGLSRYLMGEILKDWEHKCDGIYLFANDTVLDFYPKFGFQPETEYQYSMPLTPHPGTFKKLDMENDRDKSLLRDYYEKSNPYSRLSVLNNYSLLMFYCSSFLKDCVYYSPEYDAVVIYMTEGQTLICSAVYCDAGKPLHHILASMAPATVNTTLLEFTPKDTENYTVSTKSWGDTLFVLTRKENIFKNEKLSFPSLSHA